MENLNFAKQYTLYKSLHISSFRPQLELFIDKIEIKNDN